MGFTDSVRVCLRDKYATFSGRAARSEFWWFMLFYAAVTVGFIILALLAGGMGAILSGDVSQLMTGWLLVIAGIYLIFVLATLLPFISLTVRRFHDVNLSGWWYLGCLVVSGVTPEDGILAIVGLVVGMVPYGIGLIKGTTGDNKFGPDPLAEQDPARVFA